MIQRMNKMKLTVTPKMLDARHIGLSAKCHLHVHEGTIRSSKTVTAIEEFMDNLHNSSEELHLIAAADLDAIRDNILESDLGLLRLYKEAHLRKGTIGGYFVEVNSFVVNPDTGEKTRKVKKIILAGYTNQDKWKKILGKTIGIILVDEVNIASEQFIDECFARQASVDNPLMIWTLNGDAPTHFIYTKYINKCRIVGEAPASIRADMDKTSKTKGWWYQHWTMKDNPIMTQEKIDRVASIYPVGSYYYTIKFLGERGVPGKLIFLDYMNRDLHLRQIDYREYTHFGIGVDIGATRAKNSFVLAGFTENYERMAFLDKMTFQSCGYREKTDKLKAFVQLALAKNLSIEYIAIDSAEENYIQDIRSEFAQLGLPDVIPSYKATIKERIDAMIILLSRGAVEFNDTEEGRNIYDAYRIAKWSEGKEGQEREDNNEWQNDVMDSSEYAFTRHMKKLLRANREIFGYE